jgi:hypothetical protein
MMPKRRRPPRRADAPRGRKLRTSIEVASLIGVFAFFLFAGAGYMVIGNFVGGYGSGGLYGAGTGGDPALRDGQAFRVGSILLMPPTGKICEERQFDNHTGHIVADAMINCEAKLLQLMGVPVAEAAADQGGEKNSRMRAVLGTFKR